MRGAFRGFAAAKLDAVVLMRPRFCSGSNSNADSSELLPIGSHCVTHAGHATPLLLLLLFWLLSSVMINGVGGRNGRLSTISNSAPRPTGSVLIHACFLLQLDRMINNVAILSSTLTLHLFPMSLRVLSTWSICSSISTIRSAVPRRSRYEAPTRDRSLSRLEVIFRRSSCSSLWTVGRGC